MSNRKLTVNSPGAGDCEYVLLSDANMKMESYEQDLAPNQDLRGFTIGYGLSQLLGLSCVLMVVIWTSHYMGGFSGQSNPQTEFNYHPVFMVLGMVFLYGNGILVYRALRTERKSRLKLLHGALHALAFLSSVVALKTAFDSHNLASPPIANLYTLHSWMGLLTVILFCCQLLCGFVAFLFPGVRQWLRAQYLPLHVYFGLAIFVLAVATALMGILEKLIFKLTPGKYQLLPGEAVLGNMIGVCLVCFATMVVFLATRTAYRRTPLPEEAALPLRAHTPTD